jgi:hypothetical protein
MSYSYYQYQVSVDVGSQAVNLDQLDSTLRDHETLKVNFIGLSRSGDQLSVIYEQPLSGEHKSALDQTIADHQAIETVQYHKEIGGQLTETSIKNKDVFITVGHYVYRGTTNDLPLKMVRFYLEPENSITAIGMRVIDITHGEIVSAEDNVATNSLNLYELTTIANLPNKTGVLELQVKKNDGKNGDKLAVLSVWLLF